MTETPGDTLSAGPPRGAETGFIARDALISRIEGAWPVKLLIVQAPAGYGKSHVARQWWHRLGVAQVPRGWIGLDESDASPEQFVEKLLKSLTGLAPDTVPRLLALLGSAVAFPERELLEGLARAVVSERERLVLFLDDYHLIHGTPASAFVERLIKAMPAQLNLVLTTRKKPDFPLARLRLSGDVLELGQADLCFTAEEASAFFEETCQAVVPEHAVAEIHNRTEGWPAGLRMAAISLSSMTGSAAPRSVFDQANAQDQISEYLFDEVLRHLPEDLARFMFETAALTHFSVETCEGILEWPDAADRLRELGERNLFLIRLDGPEGRYRYHHLIQELLLARISEAQRRDISARASRWFENEDRIVEAVSHALLADLEERAVELVERHAVNRLLQGYVLETRRLLDMIPAELQRNRPGIVLCHVWLLMQGASPEDAATRLEEARLAMEVLREADRDAGIAPSEISVMEVGMLSAMENFPAAKEKGKGLLERLPADRPYLSGTLANILGHVDLALGELSSARRYFERARAVHSAARHYFGVFMADLLLGLTEKNAGNLRLSEQIFRQSIRDSQARLGPGSYPEALASVALAEILYEYNDLRASERLFHQHRQVARSWALVVQQISIDLLEIRLLAAAGQRDDAVRKLDLASLQPKMKFERYLDRLIAERLRLTADRADVSPPPGRPRAADPGDAGPDFVREFAAIAVIRRMISEGESLGAIRATETLLEQNHAAQRKRREIELLVLRALAFHNLRQMQEAGAALTEALRLAEGERFVRTFLDEGPQITDILRHLSRDQSPVADPGIRNYINQLLAAARAGAGAPASPAAPGGQAVLLEALTQREQAVLAQLALGNTNDEIGGTLGMKLPTVKWHLGNIYSKLSVRNRAQAILSAQHLGLIPPHTKVRDS
ncbi:LuxR C-terminal-related transcriptional regulator [Roseovarius sp.]|uniref:LuxR C-terminal-related transcriptional regulator n=1 Tax=Roseovarius sp. TaxID=1486281 RepID=UPI003B5A68C5